MGTLELEPRDAKQRHKEPDDGRQRLYTSLEFYDLGVQIDRCHVEDVEAHDGLRLAADPPHCGRTRDAEVDS